MPEQPVSWSRAGGKLLREEHKIRLALVLLLVLFLLTGRAAIVDFPAVVVAAALMAAGLLVSRMFSKSERKAGSQQFQVGAVALALLDLIAISLLLRGTGGLNSGFFALYCVTLIFAAAFFRGLELALLTALAILFYIGVSVYYIDSVASLWHLSAGLIGLVVVAWYSYALSGVLHHEKENNDQLLRHLTEGVMLFDRDSKVTLVNSTLLQMIGDVADSEVVGRTRQELMSHDKVLAWLLGDVGMIEPTHKTRVGCFPEADLPLVECTTIPCTSESDTGGWVVVCKDLRDLKTDLKATPQTCDKLAPLSNLRALSEALYGMAEYLDDKRRWQAVEVIEKHTLALQSILADMLHHSEEAESGLELDFMDVSGLLSSTRRLLEIQPVGEGMDIEITAQQGLPEINADRGRLGHCLLQLCKGLMAVGTPADKLVVGVRSADRNVIFTLEVKPKVETDRTPTQLSDDELSRFGEMCDLPLFRVIEEHHGHWECRPDSSHYRRIVFDLPISGPAHVVGESESDGKVVRIAGKGASLPLQPSLAAEVTNQLRNTLNVIRGYAEMALQAPEGDRQRDALQYAVTLSDQASELVETLQPSTGEFHLEAKLIPTHPDIREVHEVVESSSNEGVILVVDDDPAMRGLVAEVLRASGYKTLEASDGREGVELIQTQHPALAFVDLSMPRVTGIEVMREARKYAPGLPVVLMTGYATQVAVEALGDEKPYAILSKPFAIDALIALAKAVIKEPSVPAS